MKRKLLFMSLLTIFSVFCSCTTAAEGNTEEVISDSVTESQPVSESTEPVQDTTTEEEEMKDYASSLTYIGHAAVKLKTSAGTIIYVDPAYDGGDYSTPADIILITHGHSDHDKTDTCTQNEGCHIIKYDEALQDGKYQTFMINDVTIEAVPAGGNPNHNVKNCVGYLITFDGITVYHAGDTSTLDTMSDLSSRSIDYAMYPIDGTYNMDATEATEVANTVKARVSIPIHEFDSGNTLKSDKFLPEGRLVIPYGDTIELLAE